RDDAVHVAGIRNTPLKGLLRAHGEADDRLQMAHPKLLGQQLMHRLHVVADSSDGKARTVEGFRRVAGRRGASITKQLRRNEELTRGIKGFSRSNQPFV